MPVTAVVETPKRQGLKFGFDPLPGCMKLNKIMPAGLVFPECSVKYLYLHDKNN